MFKEIEAKEIFPVFEKFLGSIYSIFSSQSM